VSNTYITIGDKCFKQIIGIPMGTNSGGNIVDFYLSKAELDFMKQLLNGEEWYLLDKFSNTTGYLDDILSIDNDYFHRLLYTDIECKGIKGIYPRQAVTLNLESKGTEVNYIDLTLVPHTNSSMKNKLYTIKGSMAN